MATLSLYLDTRRGDNTIRFRVYHKSAFYISSGVSCDPKYWNNNLIGKQVQGYKAKNIFISSKFIALQEKLFELERDGRINSMANKTLKELLLRTLNVGKEEVNTFLFYMDKFVGTKTNKGTIGIYNTTHRLISEYDEKCTLETMDRDWLINFDKWMNERGCGVNYRSIQLRNIRAVFNYCIDEEITNLYPFRRFKIKTEETRKRCISPEQLRQLRDFHVEPFQERYRDVFMLIFYLIGINIGDLCLLKPNSLINGRIEFKRLKTKRLYSIKVEPEAMEIINRYKGKDYLLNIMDEYSDYKSFLSRLNKALKKIGDFKRVGHGGKKEITPLMNFLSTYWARHTWATMAAYLDIPKETIAAALGHAQDSVTDIYIKLDPRKVDKANRDVIDFLNSNKSSNY